METISLSRVQTYLLCPLKYRFQYIDKIPRPWRASALAFGTSVHAAIEWFHRERIAGRTPDAEAVESIFAADWFAQNIEPIVFKEKESQEGLADMGRKMLQMYVQQALGEPVPLAIEESFEVELAELISWRRGRPWSTSRQPGGASTIGGWSVTCSCLRTPWSSSSVILASRDSGSTCFSKQRLRASTAWKPSGVSRIWPGPRTSSVASLGPSPPGTFTPIPAGNAASANTSLIARPGEGRAAPFIDRSFHPTGSRIRPGALSLHPKERAS